MLEKNKEYPLTEIIDYAINILKDDSDNYYDYNDFYLYSKTNDTEGLIVGNSYFYADYPDVTDDGEEIFPDIVEENNLEVAYSGELFMDVISLAFQQKSNASYDEYVKALNYYYENDDFLDLV